MNWLKKLGFGGSNKVETPVVTAAPVITPEVTVEQPKTLVELVSEMLPKEVAKPAPPPKPKKTGKVEVKKVKVTWLKSASASIAQVYSTGLQYALVNDANEQCHDFVFCKDFIQDAYHGFLHNQPASIYGFTYNPTTQPPLSLTKLRIMLVNSKDSKMGEKMPAVLDFINKFCKKMKLKPSKVYEVENPPKTYAKCGAWIIEGSGMWINAPVLISMYSLLLRVGFTHKIGDDITVTIKNLVDGKTTPYQSNDRYQLQSAQKGIEQILKLGYRKHFFIDTAKNYPAGTAIGTMHNSTGIVAFATGGSKGVCKYWTRKSILNPKPKEEVPAEGGEPVAEAPAAEVKPVKKAPQGGLKADDYNGVLKHLKETDGDPV